ncbi:hypothetical protein [Parvularcula dongshanensis]|uniref:hypothetical protein n=1 Tax=Parvularcula dongshanensis TaxID=1173995 RepID=UPI003CCD922D
MVDTNGRLRVMQVGPADVQDRDAAGPLMTASRTRFPFVGLVFADASYQGPRTRDACLGPPEIVKDCAARPPSSPSHAGGSWNAPSLGSVEIDASGRTPKRPQPPQKPSSMLLPSFCLSDR